LEENKEEPKSNSDDVDMIDDDQVKSKGVKKCRNGGIPRKALKNLINNELQTQSRIVFNELMQSKDLAGYIKKTEDEELYEDP